MHSYLINAYVRKKLHSNLCIPANKMKRFPIDYKQIFRDGVEIYLYFVVFPQLLPLKLSGIINVSK